LDKKIIALLALVIIVAPLAFTMFSNIVSGSVVQWYAKIIKYPTLAYPEPIIRGGELEVRIYLPEDQEPTSFTLHLFNDYNSYDLNFQSDENYIKATFSEKWNAWVVKFPMPEDISPGFYSYRITFHAADKDYDITMPNSVWVLDKEPDHLRILVTGDTKTPAGKPYWFEMVSESNLLHPDMFFFDGDEVNKPTEGTGWKYFLEGWLELNMPSYAQIGNHEYEKAGQANIWGDIMGYRNYSVTVGKFLFICLDSGIDGWIPMEQLKWAEKILKANPDKVKVMIWHHPLFGYKIKDEGIEEIQVNSIDDFDNLLNNGYIYSSWTDHPEEAKELFRLILEYDVRLTFTAHTHTDIKNTVVYNGKKYYFITFSGVAFDVREGDKRGFVMVDLYANGTFTTDMLTYPPNAPMNQYPNSIPIASGDKRYPFIIGYLDYHYTPANDGSRHNVGFKVVNNLNVTFSDIYIEFKVPKDKPLNSYTITPEPSNYTVIETNDYYYIRINGVDLAPGSEVYYVVHSEDDTDTPSIGTPQVSNPSGSWYLIKVPASDQGWGVKDISLLYNGKAPTAKDIETWNSNHLNNGTAIYDFWISGLSDGDQLTVTVEDFAGHTTNVTYVYQNGKLVPLVPTPTKTTTTTTPHTTTTTTTTTTYTTTTTTTTTTRTPTQTTTPPPSSGGFDYTYVIIGVVIVVIILAAVLLLRKR